MGCSAPLLFSTKHLTDIKQKQQQDEQNNGNNKLEVTLG